MPAEDVLLWAYERFGDRMCLTCSWQRQSSALVHMVSELGLKIDVVELDTQILFKETYETRDRLVARYGLELKTVPPRYTLAEQAIAEGPNLWETDPDRCCHIWKVQPLVDWDAKRVAAYLAVNEVPYNPLHDAGYPSIGCIPCTRPVRPGEDERAGRWSGSGKLECGIHGNAPLLKESSD